MPVFRSACFVELEDQCRTHPLQGHAALAMWHGALTSSAYPPPGVRLCCDQTLIDSVADPGAGAACIEERCLGDRSEDAQWPGAQPVSQTSISSEDAMHSTITFPCRGSGAMNVASDNRPQKTSSSPRRWKPLTAAQDMLTTSTSGGVQDELMLRYAKTERGKIRRALTRRAGLDPSGRSSTSTQLRRTVYFRARQ